MCGLALNPARTERHVRAGLQACLLQAGTHQAENPRGFSEIGENKQPARPACRAGYL